MTQHLRRLALIAMTLTMTFLLFLPGLLLAQVDSAAVAPVTIPQLFTTYQIAITVGLSSLILFGLAKVFPGFAAMGDWPKRGALLLAALAVQWGLGAVGGTVSQDLVSIIVGGGASALVAGGIVKLSKLQPSDNSTKKA